MFEEVVLQVKVSEKKRFSEADEITSRNMEAGKQHSSINFIGGFIKVNYS